MALDLRPATQQDAELLFKNRNDPNTRMSSHHSDCISWQQHTSWLAKCLNDSNRKLFILQDNQQAIATSRLDFYPDYIEISWSVFPEHRKLGHGKTLVVKTLALTNKPVIAEIKEGNIPSKKIAESAGLTFSHQTANTCYFVF